MKDNSLIVFYNPEKIVFGIDSFERFIDDVKNSRFQKLFILADYAVLSLLEQGITNMKKSGIGVEVNTEINQEPSFSDYRKILKLVEDVDPDCIVGIGGGSVLDTSKLIAAVNGTAIQINDMLKGGKNWKRKTHLICIPTTSGTGSEVSPNAIFFDDQTGNKVGVIHPALVPDSVYVDPRLTVSVPPAVTASTGLDALTHCIEAYVNNFSNPITDLLSLEGIDLIGRNLKQVVENGNDLIAREKLALGSLYGGMCLGPVNTGAVHALAYPLGSMYKIAHGVANAMLLPFVLEYNLEASVEKYAKVALALGKEPEKTSIETATGGIKMIKGLISGFGIPGSLSDLNIKKENIEEMAHSAIKIQRLLKNNVRKVLLKDAIDIYRKAL